MGGYKWKSEYGEPGKPLGSSLDRVWKYVCEGMNPNRGCLKVTLDIGALS